MPYNFVIYIDIMHYVYGLLLSIRVIHWMFVKSYLKNIINIRISL